MDDCWYHISTFLSLQEWFIFRRVCKNFYIRTKKDEYERKKGYLQNCAIDILALFYFQFSCQKDAWVHFITLLYYIIYERDNLRIRISGVTCSGRSSLLRAMTCGMELDTHTVLVSGKSVDHILVPNRRPFTHEIWFIFTKKLKSPIVGYDCRYEEGFCAIKKLNSITNIISNEFNNLKKSIAGVKIPTPLPICS